MNEPQPGSLAHARRQPLHGQQPGPLPVLPAGHRGAHGRARRAAHVSGHRAHLADQRLRLPAAGDGQPAADLLRAHRLPQPARLLPAGDHAVLAVPEPRLRARTSTPTRSRSTSSSATARPGAFPPSFTFGYQTAMPRPGDARGRLPTEFGDSASTDSTSWPARRPRRRPPSPAGRSGRGRGSPRRRAPAGACAGSTRLPDHGERHTGQGQSQGGAFGRRSPHRQPPGAADAGVAGGHRRAARRLRLRPGLPHLRHGGDLLGSGPAR